MLRKDGVFGYDTNLEKRLFTDFLKLKKMVESIRDVFGYNIVLTQGTFDQQHHGHYRYLQKARAFGDFLIVGVDSDEKTRARKGPDRPLIPQDERIEMLAHTRHVDTLFLKERNHEHWQLIKTVCPDVLVVSQSTKGSGTNPMPPYTEEEMIQLQEFCKRIEILPPQATMSTSARLRQFQINMAKKMGDDLMKKLSEVIPATVIEVIAIHTGSKKKEGDKND